MSTPETPYYRERLEQDLATTEEWYFDEITKMERTTDEETKTYMQVRVDMYAKNIKEIKYALEVLDRSAEAITDGVTEI